MIKQITVKPKKLHRFNFYFAKSEYSEYSEHSEHSEHSESSKKPVDPLTR